MIWLVLIAAWVGFVLGFIACAVLVQTPDDDDDGDDDGVRA